MTPAPSAAATPPHWSARRAGTVVAAGCGLALVSFIFDAGPLFACAVALGAIGLLAPPWAWLGTRGARARRVLGADQVVEGAPLTTRIEVRQGPISLGGWGRWELHDPASGVHRPLGDIASAAPVPAERRTMTLEATVHLNRRGQHALAAPLLVARDPLDLARVTVGGDGSATSVLVLPRTEPVRWLAATRLQRMERADGDTASEAMAATELEGLRPYRPGTPANRIHWPAVAAGRGLIERRLHADGDTRPLIVLDGESGDADGRALDAAVRAAASLVLELARGGGCGLLLPGRPRATMIDPQLLAWPEAYRALARVGAGASGRAGGVSAAARARSGPVIHVTAAASPRLAAGLAAGSGPGVLVVPLGEVVDGRPRGVRGRLHPVLEVSGCRGFALGAVRHSRPATGSASR